MIIDCISDLHGHYPTLEGGDLLIIAGDLTANDTSQEHLDFVRWITNQNYKKKVFIGGNHDNRLIGPWPGGTKGPFREDKAFYDFDYLCDSGTEFEGLKIWGSPWTRTFKGMNPNCMAFAVNTEEELAAKWALIPDDVDILVTHEPMHGCLDELKDGTMCGSTSLQDRIAKLHPMLHVCGHIHEGYEIYQSPKGTPFYPTIFINASHVNERYQPINKPIRVIL